MYQFVFVFVFVLVAWLIWRVFGTEYKLIAMSKLPNGMYRREYMRIGILELNSPNLVKEGPLPWYWDLYTGGLRTQTEMSDGNAGPLYSCTYKNGNEDTRFD